jgi:adenylate cyclase
MKPAIRQRLRMLAALIAALALADILFVHELRPLDNRMIDTFVRIAARPLAPDPDIVIVDVDEMSLAAMENTAGRWPWPRAVHAELLAGLAAQQPRAIVFDVMFNERDTQRPESDQTFAEAVTVTPNVYFPMLLLPGATAESGIRLADVAAPLHLRHGALAHPEGRAVLLLPLVVPHEVWRAGAINFLEDPDGVGRRYHLWLDVDGWGIPSLPARVAMDLGWNLPGDELLLEWRGAARGYRHVPFADVYEDLGRKERQRPAGEFKDKIVIIGTTASGLGDLRVTPLSSTYPGIEILATAIDNLKNQRWMREGPAWHNAILALVLLGLLWAAFERQHNVLAIGIALAMATVLSLLAVYGAVILDWRVATLTPFTAAWLYYLVAAVTGFLHERATREQAVKLFGRFLNPQVVDRIVARGETIESLSGKTREISVLFSDIRGFTSMSETQPPQKIVEILNRYFSRQVAVVFKHGGTLDKFIGDCIMAFWGAPLDDPQHAQNAVACALEMERVLLDFKRELGADVAEFDVGIGIHSGSAVVGFIGAEQKLDYTVIGDTVNLASRIEGATKGVARILVSEETMRRCGAAFDFTAMGQYKVKGRAQTVDLFEPKPR